MAEPLPADPVKLFVGALARSREDADAACSQLTPNWGEIDFRSKPFPFEITSYYQDEMGDELYRWFVSFRRLIPPDLIVKVKLEANLVEEKLSSNRKRLVNLDPGFVDFHKVVLASYKPGGQKIFLGEGVYADPTLHYTQGKFSPFPWTFPDFAHGQYDDVMLHIRVLYKKELRKQRQRDGEEDLNSYDES